MERQSSDENLQKISPDSELYDYDSCLWQLLDDIEQFGDLEVRNLELE